MTTIFQTCLLLLNLGGCLSFALQRNWPWTCVYAGASLIAAGCLWAAKA